MCIRDSPQTVRRITWVKQPQQTHQAVVALVKIADGNQAVVVINVDFVGFEAWCKYQKFF